MTNADVRRALARIEENRAARRADIDAARRPPVTSADRIGAAHAPGDPVFDTITGQTGEVIHASRENILRDPADR